MSGGNWKDMFRAAREGDMQVLEYHVRNGVDVNYVHPEILGTAVVASILAKQEATSLFLLDNGANPRLLSEFECLTPMQAALQAGLVSVQAKLAEAGVEPPAQTESDTGESASGGWFSWLWGRGSS